MKMIKEMIRDKHHRLFHCLCAITIMFIASAAVLLCSESISVHAAVRISLLIDGEKVNGSTYTVEAGEHVSLVVNTGKLKNVKSIVYKSSRKSIARVTNEGVISAKKPGLARIKVTVKYGDKKKITWVKINVTEKTDERTEEKSEDKTDERSEEKPEEKTDERSEEKPEEKTDERSEEKPEEKTDERTGERSGRNILVAYFSATGNTAPLAKYAADILNADLYEIVPKVPYTEADLAYYTDCRADREQNDPGARPEIKGTVEDMSKYDIIVIGHPIWHGQAPRIISTFLESCDLGGKTIVTFCTSHSSGLGSSAKNLHSLVPDDVTWLESRRFPIGAAREDIKAWLDGIGLQARKENEEMQESKAAVLKVKVGDRTFSVDTEKNTSAEAFSGKLRQGSIKVKMHDYGSFEKVGSLPWSLTTNDKQITTKPGDLILYQGDQITVYYDENTWSFTKLGHLNADTEEIREVFGGKDDITAEFFLE